MAGLTITANRIIVKPSPPKKNDPALPEKKGRVCFYPGGLPENFPGILTSPEIGLHSCSSCGEEYSPTGIKHCHGCGWRELQMLRQLMQSAPVFFLPAANLTGRNIFTLE